MFKNQAGIKTFFFLAAFLFSATGSARFAKPDEAPYVIENLETRIFVEASGAYKIHYKKKMKVLNEQGIRKAGTLTFLYEGQSNPIHITKVEVRNGDLIIPVHSGMIEDRALFKTENVFDEEHQILIALSQVEIGSEITMEWEVSYPVPVLSGHFGFFLEAGEESITQANLEVYSEIPLRLSINDPRKHLSAHLVQKKGKKQEWNLSLKKPIYEQIVNEPMGIKTILDRTWICFSSFKSPIEIGNAYARAFSQVLNESLPPKWNNIVETIQEQAKKEGKTKEARWLIEESLHLVTEQLRNVGNFRPIKGKYFPRSLSEIAKTGIADDKDFSVVQAALLRRLGLDAKVALLSALGSPFSDIAFHTLIPSFFTDPALCVQDPLTKQSFWIDPAAPISIAHPPLQKLSNRLAIVLEERTSYYTLTPSVFAEDCIQTLKKSLKISENKAQEKGTLTLTGLAPLGWTSIGLELPQKSIEQKLLNILSPELPETYTLDLPDLKSRVVRDLVFGFDLQRPFYFIKTGLGNASPFNLLDLEIFPLDISEKRITGASLGSPKKNVLEFIFEGTTAKNIEALHLKLDFPWCFFEQTVSNSEDGKNIIFNRTFILKSDYLSREVLGSELYQSFAKTVQSWKSIALIFDVDNLQSTG